jgi:uncharacterized glyoxalase superfamily protein PhnB
MAKSKSKSKRAASAARSRSAKPAAKKRASASQRERRKSNPATLRLRAFQPSLTVNDLDRSIRFYTDILGFIVGQRWNDDKGVLRGVMLKAGTCELGLSQDDWAKGRDRQKGVGVRLWSTTAQDVDALANRIKSAGGRLTEGPMDQSWGGRSLSVDDPDGFHWTIYSEGR